jgi:mannosyltransferase
MTEVIHTHLHPRRTGVTRHVEDMARALPAKVYGETVTVPVASFSEVWRAVRSQPAIWHAHRNNELLLGLVLRLFARNLRVVYTRHSVTEPGRYSRWLMGRADRVLSLQDHPHGVDLTRFAPPADRSPAWQKLGLGGRHGIGVIGRIRPDKGQGDFAQAVKDLPGDWRAVMVGLAKDTAWAKGLGIPHVDEVADIAPWYQGLTLIVQPSHVESFGLVLLEAMASGCCVIAADLPHYRALLEHGRTGFFYPVGDAKALRATLEPLLNDPARAEAIGHAAAEHARAHFGIEHEARALANLYAALLEPR